MAKVSKNAKPINLKSSNSYSTAKKNNTKAKDAIHNTKYNRTSPVSNKLQEAAVQYGSMTILNHASKNIFWDEDMYAVPAADKITIIKKGISKRELEAVKQESGLDYDTLSNVLSVSKAKLHSKKGAEKFDQNTSERIMLLADVIAYGQNVFEDKKTFNEWLKTSNTALGGKAPIELMDTIYGIDEVKKEIGRIEYGVF
ncbi:type II RES/Xre toxin-antitoxin system antitoxin [Parafilimonas terrae]|uniref:Putative toxin-antitoxin system antitoxin component, TIGR02293 family n=1 Tax=Parafilimonas terrae TaxID=1465490 RepID=A0A1I5SHK4_9BACT|nr:antitoxin Xre/MbcA/ParS toxin-binding domain-containing protein [Parafilimonas terrae]SFP69846.1 putative toxin-antitoxin system antitoxin component, TIGR02293 family [Parafilimonas terrae]